MPCTSPAGLLAIVAGAIALSAARGGRLHKSYCSPRGGDQRAIRDGGLRGSRRLARHLWRMCFALFVATGSLFPGQMKFIPEPVRLVPLLLVLALAPIAFLLYWMWRVRVRGRPSSIVVAAPELR